MEKKTRQPSKHAIKEAVLLFPGRIVTWRSFKQYSSRWVRGIADIEFEEVLKELEDAQLGTVVRANMSKSRNTIVFLKTSPETETCASCLLFDKKEYERKYQLPSPSSISKALKTYLINRKHVSEIFFEN